VVILSHGTLTLEHLDGHTILVILIGGEDLAALARDGSTTRDQRSHDTTNSLDTVGKRGNINDKEIISALLTSEKTSLNSSTKGNSLIGVDTLVELLAVEEVLDELLNTRDTSGTTNKNDIIDILLAHLLVLKNLTDGLEALLEQIHAKLFETSTSKRGAEVLTIEEVLELDTILVTVGKSTLHTLGLTAETLNGTLVLASILTSLLLEDSKHVLDDTLIEISTTKMGITISSKNLVNSAIGALVKSKKRHIIGTTTKIGNKNVLLLAGLALIITESDSGSGRLVDHTEDIETSDATSILSGETLRISEVSGASDDSVLNRLVEVILSGTLHLLKDHSGDLLRRVDLLLLLVSDLDERLVILLDDLVREELQITLNLLILPSTTNQTLDLKDGVLRVLDELVDSSFTDEDLVVSETDDRGSDTVTLAVGDNLDTLTLLKGCHHTESGTQIDTDSWALGELLTLVGCGGRLFLSHGHCYKQCHCHNKQLLHLFQDFLFELL